MDDFSSDTHLYILTITVRFAGNTINSTSQKTFTPGATDTRATVLDRALKQAYRQANIPPAVSCSILFFSVEPLAL